MVPNSLRRWFVVHFVADVLFAVPLFLAPEPFLTALGWRVADPLAARAVAAALFGIGIESLLCRGAGADVFRAMLNLKVIWSGTATIGLLWSQLAGGPPMGWALLAVFAGFNVVWTTYRWRLRDA